MGDLRGENDLHMVSQEMADLLGELIVIVVRHAADAEALNDNGMGMLGDIVENAGLHAGDELDDADAAVERVIKPYRAGERLADIIAHLAAADNGDLRIIDAREGVEAARACFLRAVGADHFVVEYKMDAAGVVIGGIGDRAAQIFPRVGIARVDGHLRAGQHDGLRAVLDEIIERRCGIGHRVGAVGDDKAVVAFIFFPDDLHKLDPVLRAHVCAVQIKGLHRIDLAERTHLGDALEQLLARQLRRQAVLRRA